MVAATPTNSPTPISTATPTFGPSPTNSCGNGIVGAGEQCDDGNTAESDGCRANCQVESGWVCESPGNSCRRRVQFSAFSFSSQTIIVGALPGVVAAGDFDGQNGPDLAVANEGSSSVSIIRRNADGTFTVGQTLALGNTSPAPHGLAVADLNNDHVLDLAIADRQPWNSPGGTISVFRGNGDGTFTQAHGFGIGGNPYAVAVGDADEDGNPDLLVVRSNSDDVLLMRGNGDLWFERYVSLPTVPAPASIAIGDFNKDTHLDFVTAHTRSNSMSVGLGQGDGTF